MSQRPGSAEVYPTWKGRSDRCDDNLQQANTSIHDLTCSGLAAPRTTVGRECGQQRRNRGYHTADIDY